MPGNQALLIGESCAQLARAIELLEARQQNPAQSEVSSSTVATDNHTPYWAPEKADRLVQVPQKITISIPGAVEEFELLRSDKWTKRGGSGSPVCFGKKGNYGHTSMDPRRVAEKLMAFKWQQDAEESLVCDRIEVLHKPSISSSNELTPSTRAPSNDGSTRHSGEQEIDEKALTFIGSDHRNVWDFHPAPQPKKPCPFARVPRAIRQVAAENLEDDFSSAVPRPPALSLPGVVKREHVPGQPFYNEGMKIVSQEYQCRSRSAGRCPPASKKSRSLSQRTGLSKVSAFFKDLVKR